MIRGSLTLRAVLGLWIALAPMGYAASKPIVRCGKIEKSGAYILSSDLSSRNSCLIIAANDVSVDLSGHRITFGTDPSSAYPVHGISARACWDHGRNPAEDCGESFSHISVKHGTIVQAPSAPAGSHAINIGQGDASDFVLEDLTLQFGSASSSGIQLRFTRGGMRLIRVRALSEVKDVKNRHQVEGAAVRLGEVSPSSIPDSVEGLSVEGSPQGGIVLMNPRSRIVGSDVKLRGRYTNDFGIYLWGNGMSAENNQVEGEGRGIQIAAREVRVTNNRVHTHEVAENQEYRGCELGGSFGLQLERESVSSVVADNRIETLAEDCDGRAFRATSTSVNSDNRSQNNLYVAKRAVRSSKDAIAVSLDGAHDINFDADVTEADTANLEVGWDGARKIALRRVTFRKGTNPSPNYVTFRLRPGGNDESERTAHASHLEIIDPIFENGASRDLVDLPPVGFAGWVAPAQYDVKWTCKFKVLDSASQPLPAPIKLSTFRNGELVGVKTFPGALKGVSVELLEFSRSNTQQGVATESFDYVLEATQNGTITSARFHPTEPTDITLRFK